MVIVLTLLQRHHLRNKEIHNIFFPKWFRVDQCNWGQICCVPGLYKDDPLLPIYQRGFNRIHKKDIPVFYIYKCQEIPPFNFEKVLNIFETFYSTSYIYIYNMFYIILFWIIQPPTPSSDYKWSTTLSLTNLCRVRIEMIVG